MILGLNLLDGGEETETNVRVDLFHFTSLGLLPGALPALLLVVAFGLVGLGRGSTFIDVFRGSVWLLAVFSSLNRSAPGYSKERIPDKLGYSSHGLLGLEHDKALQMGSVCRRSDFLSVHNVLALQGGEGINVIIGIVVGGEAPTTGTGIDRGRVLRFTHYSGGLRVIMALDLVSTAFELFEWGGTQHRLK